MDIETRTFWSLDSLRDKTVLSCRAGARFENLDAKGKAGELMLGKIPTVP